MRYDHTDECASNHGCESCKGTGTLPDDDPCGACAGTGQKQCDCAPPEPDYESMLDDIRDAREHRYDGPRLEFWRSAGGGRF